MEGSTWKEQQIEKHIEWKERRGKTPKAKPSPDSLLKAIHKNCVGCSGGADAVEACPIKKCPLYKYRLG